MPWGYEVFPKGVGIPKRRQKQSSPLHCEMTTSFAEE
jgi:hypothetical protein